MARPLRGRVTMRKTLEQVVASATREAIISALIEEAGPVAAARALAVSYRHFCRLQATYLTDHDMDVIRKAREIRDMG